MRKELHKLVFLFLVGAAFTFVLSRLSLLEVIAEYLLQAGPLGPVVAGFLFAFTITLTTGGSLLTTLAEVHSPLYVALWGGVGGLLGDYLFFHIVSAFKKVFFKKTQRNKVVSLPHIFANIEHSPLGRFLLPVVGGIIIASPFPDEFGVLLLGISGIKSKYFALISFTMNTLGILGLVEVIALLS